MHHLSWHSLMWVSTCKQHEPPSKPPPKHVMFWGQFHKNFIDLTLKHDMFQWQLAWELALPACQNPCWATLKWTTHLQLIIEITSRHYKYTKINNQVLPLLKLLIIIWPFSKELWIKANKCKETHSTFYRFMNKYVWSFNSSFNNMEMTLPKLNLWTIF
jgi:hypothetical protein